MAFVKIADEFGEMELILFPGVYEKSGDLWQRDTVVTLTGKISGEDKEGKVSSSAQILVDSAREVTHKEAKNYVPSMKKQKPPKVRVPRATEKAPAPSEEVTPKRLYIKLSEGGDQEMLRGIKKLIDDHSGSTEVVLVLGDTEDRQVIKLPMKVESSKEIRTSLRALVGDKNVILK